MLRYLVVFGGVIVEMRQNQQWSGVIMQSNRAVNPPRNYELLGPISNSNENILVDVLKTFAPKSDFHKIYNM